MSQQDRTDAVNEWVAGGKNAYLSAPIGQHLLDSSLKRAGPGSRGAADQRCGETEMAFAPEHDLRVLDQTARNGGQSLEPVLADADDGQPAAGCGRLARKGVTRRHATHPHPRWHDG